jgi:hypothetical protein
MSTLLLPVHTTRPVICRGARRSRHGRQSTHTRDACSVRYSELVCACCPPARPPTHPFTQPPTRMSCSKLSWLPRSSIASTPAVTTSGGRLDSSATSLQGQGNQLVSQASLPAGQH